MTGLDSAPFACILGLLGVGGAFLILVLDSFRRKLDDRWSRHQNNVHNKN